MKFGNTTLFHSAIFLICCGCVYNRKIKIKNANDTGDLNSDIYLDSIQLIAKYNYTPERHSVVTEDGYIVNLFRIPKNGSPVLLVHGIGDSSDSWLVLGPTKSMAFLLAEGGFDVWMYNARGNKYSKQHIKKISNKQYWNFSYEEMGFHDLPATIDYILNTTSQNKLSYVGFSQGTTIFLVMCSMKPEYNKKINKAILLAPVAWLTKTKYPFIDILTKNLNSLTLFAESIGLNEIFSSNPILNLYHAATCREGTPKKVLCDIEYYISYGLIFTNNLPLERFPVISSHIPAGSSTKTFLHFLQGYVSKKFQRFNYGFEKNKKKYAYLNPPQYNLSLVSAPLTLIASEVDWFSTLDDVQILKSKLSNVESYIVLNKSIEFSHIEFVYGSRINKYINEPVIKMLLNTFY